MIRRIIPWVAALLLWPAIANAQVSAGATSCPYGIVATYGSSAFAGDPSTYQTVLLNNSNAFSAAIENSTRPTLIRINTAGPSVPQLPAGLPVGKLIRLYSNGTAATNTGLRMPAGEAVNDGITWSNLAGYIFYSTSGGGSFVDLLKDNVGGGWYVVQGRGNAVTVSPTYP